MQFKSKKEEEEITQVRHRLWVILNDMDEYFTQHGHTLIITDVLSDSEEDGKLGRVSRSHSELRAFDFRTKGLPLEFLRSLENHFEEKYKTWAAISVKTGLPNLIYYHGVGDNHHGHCQVCPYLDN